MTQANREAVMRAIGIIDGVAYLVSPRICVALAGAIEILEEVLDDDKRTKENT